MFVSHKEIHLHNIYKYTKQRVNKNKCGHNQPFECTLFVWEVLTGNELRLFMGQGIFPTITIYVYVVYFSYDVVSVRDSNLSSPRWREEVLVLSHGRWIIW